MTREYYQLGDIHYLEAKQLNNFLFLQFFYLPLDYNFVGHSFVEYLTLAVNLRNEKLQNRIVENPQKFIIICNITKMSSTFNTLSLFHMSICNIVFSNFYSYGYFILPFTMTINDSRNNIL